MKIQFYRPYELGSFKKSEKVQGIEVICGKYCRECWCKDYYKCKRRMRFGWHNFCVKINRKFNFRIPLYFHAEIEENLSGTILCPKNKKRIFSCYNCTYCCGERQCNCKERTEALKNGISDICSDDVEGAICKYFNVNTFSNRYSKETGKILWDD